MVPRKGGPPLDPPSAGEAPMVRAEELQAKAPSSRPTAEKRSMTSQHGASAPGTTSPAPSAMLRPMAPATLRSVLLEAPFTLAMSSGFFGFFAHAGFLSVLEDEGLLPEALAGSSAGALVTGLWAAGVDATAQRDELFRLRREDFWDPRPGLGLLRGRLFRQRLESMLPVTQFDACRRPLTVSVFDVFTRSTKALSAGDLAPAIQASCTLPGLFQPTWHDGRPLLDGGILDRPGVHGVPQGRRVLHHHLASRSPWRRVGSDALTPPRRDGLVAVVIHGIPRVGPFRLPEGKRAFHAAARGLRRALDANVKGGVVSVEVE